MKTIATTLVLALLLAFQPTADAQRGGDRGDRGGFGGRGGGEEGGRSRGGFGGGQTRGGFGGGPPGGGRPTMDANGDGRIDQSELDRMPPQFKQMMEARGIKLQAGVSVDEFRNNMREQFMRAREEGGSPFGQRPSPASENASAGNRTAYKPSAPFRARDKERMTIDLPPKWSELDTDFDGQVALYEWMTARRDELDLFDEIDSDFDGLLTPRELKDYDDVASSGEQMLAKMAEKYARPRLTIVSANGATTIGGKGSAAIANMSKEEQQKHQETAKRYFPMMDKDKDGKISMEEFDASRRIRPMFEKAGIKVEAMSAEQFTQRYTQAIAFFQSQKGAGGDTSGRGGDFGGRGGFGRGGDTGGRGRGGDSGGRESGGRGGFGRGGGR